MNAEQKIRAAELVSEWNTHYPEYVGDRMAALLQELVDAAELKRALTVEAEPVGYLYTNVQSGESHVSDTDDDYRGPERALWHIEPVYRAMLEAAPTTAEPPADLVRDAERYRACNGSNCGCTDGISHSDECISEHDAIVNEAALADHVEHGGWKCFGCGYDGQDNQRYNRICARCGVHR